MAANLRAVEPGEKAAPETIAQAAEQDDRLGELRLMRRRIARAMDDERTPARDLSSLSRRQIEIGKEIELLANAKKEESSRVVVSDEAFDAEAI